MIRYDLNDDNHDTADAGLVAPWDPLASIQLLQGCQDSQQPRICEKGMIRVR